MEHGLQSRPKMANKGVKTTDSLLQQQLNKNTLSTETYCPQTSTKTEDASHDLYKLKPCIKVGRSSSKPNIGNRKLNHQKHLRFSPSSYPCKTAVVDIEKGLDGKQDFNHGRRKTTCLFEKMKTLIIGNTSPWLISEKEGGSPKMTALKPATTYYFDRGCADLYQTFDRPPQLISDNLAEQTAQHATQFWAEAFGFLNVVMIFFITFFLQLLRFLMCTIFRILFVGVLEVISDYMLKPILAVLFNGFLQPPLILVQNILSSVADVMEPISQINSYILNPFANLFHAFRFVEINRIERKRFTTTTGPAKMDATVENGSEN